MEQKQVLQSQKTWFILINSWCLTNIDFPRDGSFFLCIVVVKEKENVLSDK